MNWLPGPSGETKMIAELLGIVGDRRRCDDRHGKKYRGGGHTDLPAYAHAGYGVHIFLPVPLMLVDAPFYCD
jgi:hypothetical protein